jgi:hypothetical protein
MLWGNLAVVLRLVVLEFLVRFRLLQLFDRHVDHFDRPLNFDDGLDGVVRAIAGRRNGLRACQAPGDKSFAGIHQGLEIVVGHALLLTFAKS